MGSHDGKSPGGQAEPQARGNRPHTFVTQRPGSCPSCGKPVARRIVEQPDGLAALSFCTTCGAKQTRVDAEPLLELAETLRQGGGPVPEGALGVATSACPHCLALVDAVVVHQGGRVLFEKSCPSCGPSTALVSEDVDYYVESYLEARPGSEPLQRFSQVTRGCPEDCGLCPDHEQHTCLPVVEITDHCDLECPICLVDNERAHHMEPAVFERMVGELLAAEGRLESIALSGGEPTCHPQLFELVEIARNERIGRIVLLTNGLRIARDRVFAEELHRRGVYVSLQLDGLSEHSSRVLRGRDLREPKQQALRTLRELAIPTQLVFTAARGVNEEEIGDAVRLLLSEPHILSLNLQPAAFTGRGGGRFPFDPLDRLTIPGVLRAIDAQTDGLVRASDFAPLPCPHVHCVALCYLLRLDDGRHLPFARFADLREHGALLRNSATLPALPEIEQALREVTYDLFAREAEVPEAPLVLAALRRAVGEMFPGHSLSPKQLAAAGERQAKSIFIHHYMDAYNFDLARLRKCCHHYPQTDGRLMPMCSFNLFHRGAAAGTDSPRPSWGRGPWGRRFL